MLLGVSCVCASGLAMPIRPATGWGRLEREAAGSSAAQSRYSAAAVIEVCDGGRLQQWAPREV
ncbi:hypothetical protein [Actinocorallia sp. A-T 12471]|uniref:hypothetical protein n=1 Tax=Actinocorallia sp. A-T 12471 TaxID=3089813 RepID=UPI0029CD9793|nr:hypothetical protein [Actinocorallia sp. A-T 12471]MDX6739352.1 hypothetical protein [Actinocorallia sp. A-T 12471]